MTNDPRTLLESHGPWDYDTAQLILDVVDKARSMHSVYELNDDWKKQLGSALAALDRKLGK